MRAGYTAIPSTPCLNLRTPAVLEQSPRGRPPCLSLGQSQLPCKLLLSTESPQDARHHCRGPGLDHLLAMGQAVNHPSMLSRAWLLWNPLLSGWEAEPGSLTQSQISQARTHPNAWHQDLAGGSRCLPVKVEGIQSSALPGPGSGDAGDSQVSGPQAVPCLSLLPLKEGWT